MKKKTVSKMNLVELEQYESRLKEELNKIRERKEFLNPEIYYRTKNKIPQYYQVIDETIDGYKLRKLKSKRIDGNILPTRIFDGRKIIETNLNWWYRYLPDTDK